MTVRIILFDFDGTIADTLDSIVKITNRLAGEFGYKKTTQEDVEYLRNMNSMQIIKTSGIPIFKVPFLLQMVKLELNHEIQNLKPIPGIVEALQILNHKEYKLGIVTSNSLENVKGFLERNEMTKLFSFIHAGSTLFGKNKVIKNFLKKEGIPPENVIYIGDETRDIEAAKKAKIKVIAVSWGFNSKTVLSKHNPDIAINNPQDLIEAIARLQ
ncbi:HAD-IA family hydrolase [Laspinema olomoucense]|uniref:HAD-IA family hydrolase n=1 Tax=Laspinema olomoucense D3b TaxID=2953688 RepID=A0ABT2N0N6_9CYAN|nr:MULTISPECIES: HAD-IA family hydrolase [unclassified Laspinema]MCT7970945.1 HAD-IA family hydrolase [Laspinema sp. D3d]MCT7976237.1 HAD-IA family hydrolase [Laspinema sp. D3b]MCT7989985.1 HAD-IA family hydrolase [Laspinema sp. D3a]MCT7995740.1 HAD-IA family hydrolase [Laspinema sp. D3c]